MCDYSNIVTNIFFFFSKSVSQLNEEKSKNRDHKQAETQRKFYAKNKDNPEFIKGNRDKVRKSRAKKMGLEYDAETEQTYTVKQGKRYKQCNSSRFLSW